MKQIPREVKEMFLDQIEVSTQDIQNLQSDFSPEGTKRFNEHVKMISDIKLRLDIFVESEKNIQKIGKELSNMLY